MICHVADLRTVVTVSMEIVQSQTSKRSANIGIYFMSQSRRKGSGLRQVVKCQNIATHVRIVRQITERCMTTAQVAEATTEVTTMGKCYVDLAEQVVTAEHTENGEIIVRTRTISDILNELDADYTMVEEWEIKED